MRGKMPGGSLSSKLPQPNPLPTKTVSQLAKGGPAGAQGRQAGLQNEAVVLSLLAREFTFVFTNARFPILFQKSPTYPLRTATSPLIGDSSRRILSHSERDSALCPGWQKVNCDTVSREGEGWGIAKMGSDEGKP
jgi:hypothetical protein